jgi:hypothetical protein
VFFFFRSGNWKMKEKGGLWGVGKRKKGFFLSRFRFGFPVNRTFFSFGSPAGLLCTGALVSSCLQCNKLILSVVFVVIVSFSHIVVKDVVSLVSTLCPGLQIQIFWIVMSRPCQYRSPIRFLSIPCYRRTNTEPADAEGLPQFKPH